MTICIAAICRFGYNFNEQTKQFGDYGGAIITASDRMMTVERYGIEYEPFQMKRARLSSHVEVLVADDIVVHSEILLRSQRAIGTVMNMPVRRVAEIYADQFRNYKAEQAEQIFLSPFKLNTETFIEKQYTMEQTFVLEMSNKILNFKLGVEALIVGTEGNSAHIYHMDGDGTLTCHDDIGFASIGIGSMHTNSMFMAASYSNNFLFYTTFPLVYAAKRRAEIAPGVGKWTDMSVITKDTVSIVEQERIAILKRLYDEYDTGVQALQQDAINKFMKEDVEWTKTHKSSSTEKPNPQSTRDGQ